MIDKSSRKTNHIIPASTLASFITTIILNPLDVIKIKQQKGINHECEIHNKSHLITKSKPDILNKLNRCLCLDKKTLTNAFQHIIQTEGTKTFLNGLKYSLYSSSFSTISFFYLYEFFSKQIQNNQFISIAPQYNPFFSSILSRSITSLVFYPLEYSKTIQQAQKGFAQNGVSIQKGFNFIGFSTTYQRDVLFSAIYWTLAENIRSYCFKQYFNQNEYVDILWCNVIAGSVSGAFTAILTQPLDVMKTKRQLKGEHYNVSSINFLLQIIQKQGIYGVYAGIRPRMAKTIIACGSMLSLYEYFLKLFSELF